LANSGGTDCLHGDPMIVECPWPPIEASPNWRGHWAPKARAVKKYKNACMWCCKEVGLKKIKAAHAKLVVSFYPPDHRLRDQDNCVASAKNCFDAIAEVIEINDRNFTYDYVFLNKYPKGLIKVEIFPEGLAA
jgi:crossover junction endodeoxyribonuclease RusA